MDSGADVNLLNKKKIDHTKVRVTSEPTVIEGEFGGKTQTIGTAEINTIITDPQGTARQQRICFEVADTDIWDIILGLPWLEQANPKILDWKTKTWRHEVCKETIELCTTRKQARKAQRNARHVLVIRKTLHEIPKEYEDFRDVFEPDKVQGLPEHHGMEHRIELEAGKQPPWGPLYNLAETEQQTLKEYLDNALTKGWIRPSRSPAGTGVLFVPKKNGKLRLCIDYRGLNKVTIKNRASLPLLSETLDRLGKAKIWTKFDLKDAYYRIRIRKGDE